MFTFHTTTSLTCADLSRLAKNHIQVELSAGVREKVSRSRDHLDRLIESNKIIYGVNTSMGGFVNWLVPTDLAYTLQKNLINAVATNVGEYFSDLEARATMLARINSLAKGNSALSLHNLEHLIKIYNTGIVPLIPRKGSLGTSGDLGPLACVALVCCGQWKARVNGKEMCGSDALECVGVTPTALSYKEGLALINGTSAMTALGSLLVEDACHLLDKYLTISALSIEGLHGHVEPFHPDVHLHKPHEGQAWVASKIFLTLKSSSMACHEAATEAKIQSIGTQYVLKAQTQIEDAYSIRCTPQILGPIADALEYVKCTVENELNSSNDNPLIVADTGAVHHNGHFHGQYISMAMDFLAISFTTLSNLSNRRIDRFLDEKHSNGLPPFLCDKDPGLRLGLMGGQFMSAALTAENRSLCNPVSIQSLSTTADFQDIVSFGLLAARRAREIFENVKYVIAFELLCGAQAADIRGVAQLSGNTHDLYAAVRKIVPFLDQDVVMTPYLELLKDQILSPTVS